MISKKINFFLVPLMVVLAVGLGCSNIPYRGTCNVTITNPEFPAPIVACIDYYGEGGDLTANECGYEVTEEGTTTTTTKNATMCTGPEAGTCKYKDNNGKDAESTLFASNLLLVATTQAVCTLAKPDGLGGTWKAAGD